MSHFGITFPGSVINDNFKPNLLKARDLLTALKDEKLESRHKKLKAIGRLDAEGNCREVYEHLITEVKELGLELGISSDCIVVLKEVADVINCAEIIGALVIAEADKRGCRLNQANKMTALELHGYFEVVCWKCPTYNLGCDCSIIEECAAKDKKSEDELKSKGVRPIRIDIDKV